MKNPFIIQVIQDLANVSQLVNSYFKNEKTTTIWLNTENPLLSNKEPIDLIFSGQTDKIIKLINGSF